jgi:hypothetical protein
VGSEAYDLICVSESWLNSELSTPAIIGSLDYSVFRADRLHRPGGGVCVVTNNRKLKVIQVDLPEKFSDLEIVCLDLLNVFIPTRIIVCYRAPSSDSGLDDIEHIGHFIECLKFLSRHDATTLLVGDFNLPNINWSDPVFTSVRNSCSVQFSAFAKQYAFNQFVNEETRFQSALSDHGSLLDLVLCNDAFAVNSVEVVMPFSTSDHCMVEFNLCLSNIACDTKFDFRNFKLANWDEINTHLAFIDWPGVFSQCATVSDFSDAFYSVVYDCISKFVPLFHFGDHDIRKNKHMYPVYIQKLLTKKNNAWHLYKRFRTEACHSKYNRIAAQCRDAVNLNVQKREETVIEKGNLGRFFRYANSKFCSKTNVGPLKMPDGTLTIDPDQKASVLNDYFSSVFTVDNGINCSVDAVVDDEGFSHVYFTPLTVRKAIKKLKVGSAGVPDGVPPIFLKNCSDNIYQPLSFIYQMFFDSSFLPGVWLQAYITPVFKKGDPTLPSNYRPISLTCTICKIMESIIKDQLVSYLILKGLINKHQHAFIARHSTVTNLLECTSDWAISLSNHSPVDVLYIDFSRAFDSVVHSKLIYKLISFGVKGLLLNWIVAFLSGRSQCVVVEHNFSKLTNVISGVPQGSVLGPILFILFVNDVSEVCRGEVSLKMFADDLKLYSSVKIDTDSQHLQETLDCLVQWSTKWQLNINISKCQLLHLGKNSEKFSYSIYGQLVPVQVEVSDLGVIVDFSLKFQSHIDKIIGKAYSRIGTLFRGFSCRNLSFLRLAYITYIRPIMEYASCVWSPHLLKDINALENVQRHFSKRIKAISELSYTERLALLDLEPLELRRLKCDLVMYFKILNNLVSVPCDEHFTFSSVSNTRAGGYKITKPFCATNIFGNMFFNRCVKAYNSLSDYVKTSTSLMMFKNRLAHVDLSHFVKGGIFDS